MSKYKKIFRDPVYNLIIFDKERDKLLIQLINSSPLQRLKRIRQLGVSWFTYPSAIHDRFSHSLGVAYLSGKIIDHLNLSDVIIIKVAVGTTPSEISLTKEQFKLLVQCAGLLHDVGHGPFSHTFERICGIDHEAVAKHIILENEEIKAIFDNSTDANIRNYFKKWITEILDHTFEHFWANDIISSQLDADRIDYLLRDAYMCGVEYVKFDWEWIINNITKQKIPAQKEREGILIDAYKGIYSLEAFIISRYHMYEQVYFHKTTRGIEQLLNKIFERVKDLLAKAPDLIKDDFSKSLLDYFANTRDIESFLLLDDFYIISLINHWASKSPDNILKELAQCFIKRKVFKNISELESDNPISTKDLDVINKIFKDCVCSVTGYNYRKYYYLEDSYIDNPYKDEYLLGKKTSEEANHIWLMLPNEAIQELSANSKTINSLKNSVLRKSRAYIHSEYYPSFQNGGQNVTTK